MDYSESDIDFTWSDQSVVDLLNKGLKALLTPDNHCAIAPAAAGAAGIWRQK